MTAVAAEERRLPPVTELGAASLACVVVAVVFTVSYLPKHAPLAVPAAFLAAAVALLALNAALLARVRPFAWWRFFQVGRWALLAYATIAGTLEYTFVYDHTRGTLLALMTAMLAVVAVDVPLLLAFTVARYQRPER